MAARVWTLFDHSSNEHIGYEQDLSVSSKAPSAKFSVRKCGLSSGVEVVEIDTGKLRIQILPTRGMSIWKAHYAGDAGSEAIQWQSPVRGPVHPSFVPLTEPSGLGWLDGFDELLVRCGLESNGAPEFDENGQLKFPLHGRIGNKPAYRLELSIDDLSGELRLTGWVEETRFHFLKARLKTTITTKLDSTEFQIEDEITNLSASPAEVQMLYHMNFGLPLLDAGSQVIAPVKELVPRNEHAASGIDNWQSYLGETAGFAEQVYFASLHADATSQTAVLLKNAHGTRGAQLKFNTQQLPCLSVWKNTTASEDGYVTGIEPGTNFPNPRSFEGNHNRVIKLEGNASTTLQLGFAFCPNESSVAQAEQAVKKLQTTPPTIHPKPLPDWCAP